MPTPAFWRQWHRWIGAPAALFLLFVSVTGVLVAGTEFFGADEALREANREVVSAVRTDTPIAEWTVTLATAMKTAAAQAPGAPVDRVSIELKGQSPTIAVYVGKPAGGEDKRLLFDARSGAFLRAEDYVDKPLIHRIHSGEAFGDGGLVVSMVWGLALLALTLTGLLLYWRLMNVDRPDRVGLKRFFF
ncbi:MAG: PepSY domain-containing protein [Gemmatimonadaceae bacterium]|nr:PepSY domain-containing protein [Gemmatimonadaceae bacterium]